MKEVEIAYRYQGLPGTGRPRPANPNAARRRLDNGNKVFAKLLDGIGEGRGLVRTTIPVDSADLGLGSGPRSTPKQRPYAAILGCADARVPIELVFGEGPNDLFVVRIAGNVLGNEVLGSLSYAIEHLGGSLKLIAVLGHSGCGAVSAAVDVFLSPRKYLAIATNHALRSVLDRMLVVVQGAASRLADAFGADVASSPSYREALIESSIVVNAALSAFTLQSEIAGSRKSGLSAVFGVYLLDSHRVWAPRPGGGEWDGLADPPADQDAFAAFGTAVIRSERISALLG